MKPQNIVCFGLVRNVYWEARSAHGGDGNRNKNDLDGFEPFGKSNKKKKGSLDDDDSEDDDWEEAQRAEATRRRDAAVPVALGFDPPALDHVAQELGLLKPVGAYGPPVCDALIAMAAGAPQEEAARVAGEAADAMETSINMHATCPCMHI